MIKIIFKDKEKYKNKYGIYGIRNIVNNNVYVGQTCRTFILRYNDHKHRLNKNKHFNNYLQRSWNKYGEDNFEFFIIDVVNNTLYLDYLEKYYINYYRSKHRCYNILDGGIDGYASDPHGNYDSTIKNRAVISEETAKEIKIRLMNNETPKQISFDLNINYRTVNNILSNNTWSHVRVRGWDEWRESRKTWTRLKKEDHEKIYDLHINHGYNKYELAEMYNKGVKMIEKILLNQRRLQRKLHGNPVAS